MKWFASLDSESEELGIEQKQSELMGRYVDC